MSIYNNDSLSKGKPAGMTYLAIWCRLNSPGIVELSSEKSMAFETGFSGERAVDTWRKRMKQLKALGFIDYKGVADHDYQWVLVLNPHHVVQRLGSKVQERLRSAWWQRGLEIGAKDLKELPETVAATKSPATKSPLVKGRQKVIKGKSSVALNAKKPPVGE